MRYAAPTQTKQHELLAETSFGGYQPPAPVQLALSAGLETNAVRLAVRWGQRDPNLLANMVFFHRHPERKGRKLAPAEPNFTALSREWIRIRDTLVRPLLESQQSRPTQPAPTQSVPTGMPRGPFGTLTILAPNRKPFSYNFSPEDVLWTARFIVGEAGGRDDTGNHAVIWAMFNRFALFAHTKYPTFQEFIRAYSTPLQPVLHNKGAARRHMNNPDFVRTGGTYPGTDIPKGQLGRFLQLQQRPWSDLPPAARNLALRALTGGQPNPGIGNASEFANTAVYFKDRYRRVPSEAEWRQFTTNLPKNTGKKWTWIGDVPGLVQYRKNTFFLDNRARGLQVGEIRVVPPR
jgi:hypothetical protein